MRYDKEKVPDNEKVEREAPQTQALSICYTPIEGNQLPAQSLIGQTPASLKSRQASLLQEFDALLAKTSAKTTQPKGKKPEKQTWLSKLFGKTDNSKQAPEPEQLCSVEKYKASERLCELLRKSSHAELTALTTDKTRMEALIQADWQPEQKRKAIFDYLYADVKDVSLLQKLIDARFGVPVGRQKIVEHGGTKAEQDLDGIIQRENRLEQAWTSNGLIHLYSVYMRLPRADLDLINGVITFDTNQVNGSGGSYKHAGIYYVNYEDDPQKTADDPKNPINRTGKFVTAPSDTRQNLINADMTMAHELGHLVDAKAKGGPYSERFDGSGKAQRDSFVEISDWNRHEGPSKILDDLKKNLVDPYAHPSFQLTEKEKKLIDLSALAILQKTKYTESEVLQIIKYFINLLFINVLPPRTIEYGQVALIHHLIRAGGDKNKVYQEEPYNNMPKRQMHKDYLSKNWFSYPNSARSRGKVSSYQFRTPGEEFAEVYASYYISKPKGKYTPPVFKPWIQKHLDKEKTKK